MKHVDMTSEEYRELQEARENEHDAYITKQRAELERSLAGAVGAAGNALWTVRHLSSDQVYDVDYAESTGDVERLVQSAQDLLSAALALARQRHR